MVKVYKDFKQGKATTDFLQVLAKELNAERQDGEHTVAGTISELLEILDQMENEVKSAIGNGQDNQVQSGVTYSDFKQRIERENETFDKMIEQSKDLIDHFARQLVQLNNRLGKCHETLEEIKTTIDGALSDYTDAEKDYTAALQRLREELELFDELYAYQSSFINQKNVPRRSRRRIHRTIPRTTLSSNRKKEIQFFNQSRTKTINSK